MASGTPNASPGSTGAPAPAPAAGSAAGGGLSPTKVTLTLLLVNGQRKEGVACSPKDTVQTTLKTIYEDWPNDFGERPPKLECLRILYRGRFLEPNSTLEDAKLPVGEASVVHLIVKAADAVDASSGDKPKAASDDDTPRCKCTIM